MNANTPRAASIAELQTTCDRDSTPAKKKRGRPGSPPPKELLNIQILHIQRILFNKLPPSLHILTHQSREDGLALGNVFQLHRKQSSPFRIHRRLPQLRSRHLPQPFVALHIVTAAAFFLHILEKLASRSLLHRL